MKTAILGVWHVHAPAYTKTAAEHGEVLGFFERNDALAEAFAAKTGLTRFPTREALLTSGCEGVIVCSATCDHEEDIIAAAEAGKHVFTEKVLALTDAAHTVACALYQLGDDIGKNVQLSLVAGDCMGNGKLHEFANAGALGNHNADLGVLGNGKLMVERYAVVAAV